MIRTNDVRRGAYRRACRSWPARVIPRVIVVLAMLQGAACCAQTTRLSLTTGALPPLTASPGHPGFIAELAREAFGRVGVAVDVAAVPTERSLINVSGGLDDGDIFRVAGMERLYPNLVRIPEKTLDNEFVAYTLHQDIEIKSWADLRPYSVAYATGWKPYEQNVVDVRLVTRTPSIHELIPMLLNGRADIVLMDRWQGGWEVYQGHYKVRRLDPPLARYEMFMYLNKKHEALVERVAAALVAMKADGTWQSLFDRYLKPVDGP
jgi:polar amino acid transport system substrate-binding protein